MNIKLYDEDYVSKCNELKKIEDDLDLEWSKCENFKNLLHTNKKYIQGKINASPYYLGPLDDPSPRLIENLLKLHDYGLLTVDGQESKCVYGEISDEEFFDQEQRGYLHFTLI